MLFSRTPLLSLALAAIFAYAQGAYLNNDLSFGHSGKYVRHLLQGCQGTLTSEGYHQICKQYRISIS
jgi:hypothetical protein